MAGVINNVQISGYNDNYLYTKYDVVSGQTGLYPFYFVSAVTGNSGQLDDTTWLSNSYWKRFDDPNFVFGDVWNPSYQTSVSSDLRQKLVPYGDGYTQRSESSLFFGKIGYEMTLENIDNVELKSLVAFFEYKGGTDFIKADIPPFVTGRKFLGRNWKHNHIADNINTFNASLYEFVSDSNV